MWEVVPLAIALFFLTAFGLNLFFVRGFRRVSRRVNVVIVVATLLVASYEVYCVLYPSGEAITLDAQCSVYVPPPASSIVDGASVKIITFFDPNQHFGMLTSSLNSRYANYMRYSFQRHSPHCQPPRRAVQWTKIALLFHEIARATPSVRWLVWIDADALFTNWVFPLDIWLSTIPESTLLIVGPDIVSLGRPLNTGWMAVRVGPKSLQLLQQVWNVGAKLRKRFAFAHEQEALTYLLREGDAETRESIQVYEGEPGVKMYSEEKGAEQKHLWKEGDLVAHAAGWPGDSKIDALKNIRAKIVQA